jgi:hypothetical protein
VTIKTALREVNNAVLDLQTADYNTFERPLERMAKALNAAELKPIIEDLKSKADFDQFLENASDGGGMMGSARLNWPTEREEELGIAIHLIERAAQNPNWFLSLAHRYYYSGRKIVGDIRKITASVIVPFNRDLTSYVEDLKPVQTGHASASSVTYNIGSMHNSPLQHIAAGGIGIQTSNYSANDLQAIVDLYKRHVGDLDLDPIQRRKADAQVATIEAQLLDEPDSSIVAAAGKSLKTIIEGAIGGSLGTAIASAPVWAPVLAMF